MDVQITFAAGRLHVRVAATGDAVGGWSLGEDRVEHLEVRDGNARPVPFEPKDHGLARPRRDVAPRITAAEGSRRRSSRARRTRSSRSTPKGRPRSQVCTTATCS
jgi:hypothetical protein